MCRTQPPDAPGPDGTVSIGGGPRIDFGVFVGSEGPSEFHENVAGFGRMKCLTWLDDDEEGGKNRKYTETPNV